MTDNKEQCWISSHRSLSLWNTHTPSENSFGRCSLGHTSKPASHHHHHPAWRRWQANAKCSSTVSAPPAAKTRPSVSSTHTRIITRQRSSANTRESLQRMRSSACSVWFLIPPPPIVSELILSRAPECRLSSRLTVWLRLTWDMSEQLAFVSMLAEQRRGPRHWWWLLQLDWEEYKIELNSHLIQQLYLWYYSIKIIIMYTTSKIISLNYNRSIFISCILV